MMRLLALAGFALAVSVPVATPMRAFAQPSPNPKHHVHHLHQAEKDLTAAEMALSQQNVQKAHKDVAAAIHQVEEAIHHHHKNFISQPTNSGLTGSFNRAQHHHHHGLLHKAVHEMRAAEKQLKTGTATAALKDIERAKKTIAEAIHSHHHLIGK